MYNPIVAMPTRGISTFLKPGDTILGMDLPVEDICPMVVNQIYRVKCMMLIHMVSIKMVI